MMCNSVGQMNNSDFGHEENEFVSTHPLLRYEALHFIKDERGGKAIHPKLPIEVYLKWRVNITSIGHQSKSRNKMWILNHLIWLASIGNWGFECKFISLYSIGMSLWSLDQKMSPTDLQHSCHGQGIFFGENTLEVALTWEHDGLHMVPLPGSCGWNRRVIKNDLFSSNHSFLNLPWDMVSRKIMKKVP